MPRRAPGSGPWAALPRSSLVPSLRLPSLPSAGPARIARALVLVAVTGLVGGASCPSHRPLPPRSLGAGGDLDARPADPGYGDAWDRLQAAHEIDPGSDEARALADELLAGDPPPSVRLAALRARAEHAYLHQDDPLAIASAEEGLSLAAGLPAGGEPAAVLVDLARVRARALVRGGDPATALAALEEPLVGMASLPPAEALGLWAVARDRNGDGVGAVAAFAAWREALADDDPTAPWAEQRLAQLAQGLPPEALAEAAAALPSSPARACLQGRLGEAVPAGMPGWVAGCARASGGIGILLPRSGPFAAFADEQLAAALATVEVVSKDGPPPPLAWRDSGSTTTSALTGARALVDDGVRVLVGPIGAKNVKAVADEVERRARVIVPGEGSGSAAGVAPSLEQRVRALVEVARAARRDRLVVLAPDNAYGRRAVKAVEAHATGFPQALVVRTYPPETTSFGPLVNPVMTALRGDAALLVPDTLTRTDLVIRQLARAGRMPARPDVPGLMVLVTAEGLSPAELERGRDVLEGVWVAPAAARGPEAEAFEAAYTRLQGEPPGDQGLLVFYALQQAITGQPGPGAGKTTVTRVEGGRLVVEPPTTAQ